MSKSILAGLLISIGVLVFTGASPIVGSFLFGVGLLAVLHFGLELYTGKAGLLATGEIKGLELMRIWFGNFIGAGIGAFLIALGGFDGAMVKAMEVAGQRMSASPLENLVRGIFCGVLMYIAVTGYKESGKMAFVFVPVAGFLIGGCAHIVADFVYWNLAELSLMERLESLISWIGPVSIGNLIGCNLLNVARENW